MTSFTNIAPQIVYGDILTCTNGGQGLKNSQTNLQDGLGNNSPILIATNSVNFDRGLGQFQLDAVAVTANSVDINSMCQANPIALGNASIRIPKGTTAQRPGGAVSADFRFNTDVNNLEFYNGTTWLTNSSGGTVTSITGTAGQINVANPTTTPVLSIAAALTGISSITSASGVLTLNATLIDLNPVSALTVSGNRFVLNSACSAWFYNNTNTFKASLSGLVVSQDANYYWPSSPATLDNQALTIDTLGFMSWSTVQLMTPINAVGSQGLLVNRRYIVNSVGPINLSLPSAGSIVGDIIEIVGNSAIWNVIQNAGQTIHFGAANTTTGVTGSVQATVNRSCITLVCVIANTDWVISNNSTTLVLT